MEKQHVIPAVKGEHNLKNYDEARIAFRFSEVEKEFSWYQTGKINIAHEAVDRNVDKRGLGDKIALYFSDGVKREDYTFKHLKLLSNKFANVLKEKGIQKGDRVAIFLPRSPELYISFLAVLKTGAVVVPLFEAFMEGAVKDRMADSEASAIITNRDLLNRVPREKLPALKHVFLTGHGDLPEGTFDWHSEINKASSDFKITWVDREDPYLILYASDAMGKAKGIVHVHYGMVGHYITAKWVHDLKSDDIYWCTADPGWITGIVYGFLAPWMHGVSVVIRGGRFKSDDWCSTLQDYKVTVWYSAPTAFRMLIAGGDELLRKYDLSNLRHILSVGEPLTLDVLNWSLEKLKQPIYDTWWMSETGMNMICNYRCLPIKVGSIGKPFPGVEAAIIDDDGNELSPYQVGNLAIKSGWPSMLRGIWGSKERYEDYFKFKPWFVSGDAAYIDEDGYFYFQGRVDDVINTSGERVGPYEVESRLEEHPAVALAGVVGKPDPIRGEIVKAYITLNPGYTWSDDLKEELRNFVKLGLAAHAAPREFEVREDLPRDKEGKVMRKILKGWVLGLPENK